MTILAWTVLCVSAFFALSIFGAHLDIKHRRVPNSIFIAIFGVWIIWRAGCIFMSIASGDQVMIERESMRSVALLAQSILTYALALMIATAFERFAHRFAIGGADLKFISAIVAFLSWDVAIIAIMLGYLVGLLYPVADSIAGMPSRGVPLVASIASVLPLTALII